MNAYPWHFATGRQVSFSIISVITGIPSLFLYGLVSGNSSSSYALYTSDTVVDDRRSCGYGVGMGRDL